VLGAQRRGAILKKVGKACKSHRTLTGSMSKQLICTSCFQAHKGDTKAAQAWGMSKPTQALEFTRSPCQSKSWCSPIQMAEHLKVVMQCKLWQEANTASVQNHSVFDMRVLCMQWVVTLHAYQHKTHVIQYDLPLGSASTGQ